MDNKNIKVLVVDDEADFRQLMKFWLETKGYSVIVASGGEEAIDITEKESSDIIFMDLRMPGIDGVETIKRIRRFNKVIPIIVISAYADELKIEEANQYQISGVFHKDKGFDEGLALLESALRTHKQLKKEP